MEDEGMELLRAATEKDYCAGCGEPLDDPQQECEYCAGREGHTPAVFLKNRPPYTVTKWLLFAMFAVYGVISLVQYKWPLLNPLWFGKGWAPRTISGQWWRLLSEAFVHINLFHLLTNCLFLWFFGRRMEWILGRSKFLFFCLSSAVIASLVALPFVVGIRTCGASGMVMALAGGLLSYHGLRFRTISNRAHWKLGAVFLVVVLIFRPNYSSGLRVDTAAHVAGLIAGLVLGVLLTSRSATTVRGRRWIYCGVVALIVAVCGCERYTMGYLVPVNEASISYEHGQPGEALRLMRSALARKPDDAYVNIMAADAFSRNGDDASAEPLIRHAIAVLPESDNGKAYYMLGEIYIRRGNSNAACKIALSMIMRRAKEPYNLNLYRDACPHPEVNGAKSK